MASYKTMIFLLLLLAVGASIGTFIENDFGSARAKSVVYHAFWYQLIFFLLSLNLLLVIKRTKMYRIKARTLFHLSFILILFGATLTHYFGLDGMMQIREGERSNILIIGEERLEIPFSIFLKDFKLTRYAGSRSPSAFSSDVVVEDKPNAQTFEREISMNHTLTYQGYKFFQTSYDTDEKGTKLSVNKDTGVEVTYLGYLLLFIGLIWNLFDKQSRVQFLMRQLKKMSMVLWGIGLAFGMMGEPLYAQESAYLQGYLDEHLHNSSALAEALGGLVVQDPVGRMKPLGTQNKEVLNKLTGKSSWRGMSANQVTLGMFSRPELWKKVEIIKVKTSKLRGLLGVGLEQKLVRFIDFFDVNGRYKLTEEVERANQLVPSKRGTFERDLIRVDERLNIAFMTYRGVLWTIFPLPDNAQNKWVDFKTMFALVEESEVKRATSRLLESAYNRHYTKGLEYIAPIEAYQERFGQRVMPSKQKLEIEIAFNQTDLFFRLSMVYLLFGVLLLIWGVSEILSDKSINPKIKRVILFLGIFLFGVHTLGIALRWYIGGYAPISNTYETMVYIAYASVIAGVFFLRQSIVALSASFVMAGIFIFSAYLGEIDPEITNLVPVLKSYWLSVHVSVITASYGFFGVGAILGFITLILFIFSSSSKPYLKSHIKNLTHINEFTLTLGLTLLVIGNFLGGIWANESWGRYWGWDPKETWAYISILVYVMVLHLRLIKSIYSFYLFGVVSVLAFASILMTYFGVNFYLAGMHSYATGDPVPIPDWVYIIGAMVFLIITLAYPKRNLS